MTKATLPNFTLRREGVKCASSGDFLSSMKKEPKANGVERPKKNLPPIFSCPTPGHPKAALDAFFTASQVKRMNQRKRCAQEELLADIARKERMVDRSKFLIEARMGLWAV